MELLRSTNSDEFPAFDKEMLNDKLHKAKTEGIINTERDAL
jgi:hypothetical protein